MTTGIAPFSIEVGDDVLDDLHRRLSTTRWPEPAAVDDRSQGIPLADVQELARYWADGYDWRSREALLNRYPGFITEIDGCDIHFQHIASSNEEAMPLVITHGWPGSIVEFQKIIPLLTEPQDHGGAAIDAFDVVCPSLPGYGFSGKPTASGWTSERIGAAWGVLMSRLGYGGGYVAQGGDWGSAVTTALGQQKPPGLLAIHTNMPVARPGPDMLENLDATERNAIEVAEYFAEWGNGYFKLQSTRPQTLGYGLGDSPAGQLAWIMEKVADWTDPAAPVTDAFTPDELLDNVMFYWLTNSATSSARLYWESGSKRATDPVQVPTCVSTFPNEIIKTSRRWAEATLYPDIAYWRDLDQGGHFPAWQLPEVMAEELRTAFRAFR